MVRVSVQVGVSLHGDVGLLGRLLQLFARLWPILLTLQNW
jgi:hypothetical protein